MVHPGSPGVAAPLAWPSLQAAAARTEQRRDQPLADRRLLYSFARNQPASSSSSQSGAAQHGLRQNQVNACAWPTSPGDERARRALSARGSVGNGDHRHELALVPRPAAPMLGQLSSIECEAPIGADEAPHTFT